MTASEGQIHPAGLVDTGVIGNVCMQEWNQSLVPSAWFLKLLSAKS
jgi:hypothetical protein